MKKTLTCFAMLSISAAFMAAPMSADTADERAERKSVALFENDARRGEEVGKLCFTSHIDGLSETTERAAILSKGVKEYLVTTSQRCNALRKAKSVSVEITSSCIRPGDRISGCFVDEIYEWNSDAEIADSAQNDGINAG